MVDAAAIALLPDEAAAPVESPARRALRRLVRRKGAMAGLAVIVLFVALALLAPLVAPYDPAAQSWATVRKPPSALHLFGTDDLGRDVLARIIFGARASLLAGVISVAIALAIGVPLGLLAGYVGGFIDALVSRITDAMLAIPFLILAIVLAAFLGPSLQNAMIAIGITTTPIFVRLTRAQVMAVKVEDYVEAARAVGNPAWRVALVHVLPNILPSLMVQASLVDRSRHHRRGGAFLSRARPAAAGAVVGQHAQRGATFPGQRAVDGGMAGPRHLRHRGLVQPARRRPARRARPARAVNEPSPEVAARPLRIHPALGVYARPSKDDRPGVALRGPVHEECTERLR